MKLFTAFSLDIVGGKKVNEKAVSLFLSLR